MNISGIILILIAAFLIYKIDTSQIGGGLGLRQMTIYNRHQDPYYARQYRELDDVNNVLNRPVMPGNKVTQGLVAYNVWNRGNELELSEPIKKYFDFSDIIHRKTPEETKVLVENLQPFFLDEAMIIDHYGEKFYWDWRYPKQPISVEFAKDPETYVKQHPNEYPSYVIKSRNYSALGPNSIFTVPQE